MVIFPFIKVNSWLTSLAPDTPDPILITIAGKTFRHFFIEIIHTSHAVTFLIFLFTQIQVRLPQAVILVFFF